MEEKIKVLNPNKSKVFINLRDFNGRSVPVVPGAFALLTPDELAYLQNSSDAFRRGYIKLEESQTLPEGVEAPEVSPNALTDVDIAKLLDKKTPVKTLKARIEGIDNIEVLRRIENAAKDADVSVKTVEAISARIEALSLKSE